MLNLVLITRADWSQQGLSLWGNRGLRLISPRLLITRVLVSWIRELQSIFLSYVNKDLIFLGHFPCHWIIAIDWPVKKKTFFSKGFPDGVWNLRVSNFHINSSSLYQMSVCSNQTNKTKTNQNFTSQEPHSKWNKRQRDAQKSKAKRRKCQMWLPSSTRPVTWQTQC